jgi:membrane protein implicated in regulation of membrane protease activity
VLAPALFVVGLVLIALAVGAMAGPWWGVLLVGVALVALAVLTQRAADDEPAEAGDGA